MAGSSDVGYTDSESKEAPLSDTLSDKEIEGIIHKFQKVSIIDKDLAKLIIDSGITSLEALADTEINKLSQIDALDKEKAETIVSEVKDTLAEEDEEEGEDDSQESKKKEQSTDGGEDALAAWLTGETDGDLGGLLGDEIDNAKESGETTKSDPSKGASKGGLETVENDYGALKSWLTGEEDSFSEWLGEESFEEEREELQEEMAEKEEELKETQKELDSKMHEAEILRQEFEQRLEELESGEFDAQEIVEENADLRERVVELESEIEEFQQDKVELKKEIEEIKQGSVAMLKYLKAQKMKMVQQGSGGEIKAGEVAVNDQELQELKQENEDLKTRMEAYENEEIEGDADERLLKQLEARKEEVENKTKRIQDLREELNFKEEQLNELREKMQYKEDELNEREADLMHREEIMKKERREIQAMKEEFGGTTEKERKRRLEELEKEISRQEQQLKAKEKYIDQKERELRAREEDLVDEELQEREEEILQEFEQEKAHTGTKRLDDLMYGGFPLGSNISIYGPPHSGKNVLINSFMAEGIQKGVPAIWVITDKTVDDVRDEMKFVLPTYPEYEIRGLVYYIDAYSISMGEVEMEEIKDGKEDEKHIKYIEDQSDIKAITEAVEEVAEEIMKSHKYYRLAFESVSTIIAYLDTSTTFRSLQPFAGRRKRDKAVSLYTLQKGMHSEQDISMLGHMMDGELEFKFQQMQTYLKVEGLGEVQVRDWVKYTHSKSGITMGSFSLDTIR